MTSDVFVLNAPADPETGLEDESLFEIIDGQRVVLPPMSAYAAVVTGRLFTMVSSATERGGVGQTVAEALFHLPLVGGRNRRPDLAYVSFERWPENRPMPYRDSAWDVVPDWVAEVVGPTDLIDEMFEKIREYFEAGVRVVWVVFPMQRQVLAFESPTKIRVISSNEELDGGPVLPGLRIPIAKLFPERAE